MAAESNPMRNIRIAKLSINTCVRPREARLDKAVKVLEQLTGQAPFVSKSRLTVRGWGIRRNEKISTSVTVMGKKAHKLLENALKVKEFELPKTCFSNNGCFGFGISEHIDLDIKYDPACGIFGLNYFVVLERPGARVARRRRCKAKIGNNQRVSDEDARQWFKENFEGVIVE
ncbi:large subunit ribosomal protein L11e [Pancytospora philotis]|nr:large subunit ribosomal protein L11e [Pancytospora philotis]